MVWLDRDRTLLGELVAAWAVAALAMVVALLGGALPAIAELLFVAWGVAYLFDILAIHLAKLRMLAVEPPRWTPYASLALMAATGLAGWSLWALGGLAPAATVWLVGATGVLGSAAVRRPKQVTGVGLALAAVSGLALFFW